MKMEIAGSFGEEELHRRERSIGSVASITNWRQWLIPPLMLAIAAAVALTFDVPVARWAALRTYPRAVRELMSLAEAFGHGVGVTVVLVTIYTLDPSRRKRLPRAIAVVVAAGCGANLLKLLIARQRPSAADLLHTEAWHTFAGWLPLGHNGSAMQSFASAHTATAVGLALVLSWFYPQGRRLFFIFAAAVAVQRVLGGAHYPSDVFAGATVGWLFAMGAFHLTDMAAPTSPFLSGQGPG